MYAITLPDGRYRFGRLLHDGAIQVFRRASDAPEFDLSMMRDVDFTVGIYKSAFKDPRMIFVTSVPFQNENEAWPPKTYMYNPLADTYSIYERGVIRPASKGEVDGLEATSVWELEHVLDRITGRVDWVEKGKQAERYRAD